MDQLCVSQQALLGTEEKIDFMTVSSMSYIDRRWRVNWKLQSDEFRLIMRAWSLFDAGQSWPRSSSSDYKRRSGLHVSRRRIKLCNKIVKCVLVTAFFTLTESPCECFLVLTVEDLFVARLRGVSFCCFEVRLEGKGVGALVVRLLSGLVPVH